MSEAMAAALERIVRYAAGSLDRPGAAMLALERGLSVLAEEAEIHAARHVRACPRCAGTSLGSAQADGILLQGCATCGGVWLDRETFRRFVHQPTRGPALLAATAARNAQQLVATADPVVCPVCDARMQHKDFPAAGLRLDVCEHHGTWSDRSELVTLAELLLEQQQRAAELERAIRGAQVDAEIQQLRDLYQAGYAEGAKRSGATFWTRG